MGRCTSRDVVEEGEEEEEEGGSHQHHGVEFSHVVNPGLTQDDHGSSGVQASPASSTGHLDVLS